MLYKLGTFHCQSYLNVQISYINIHKKKYYNLRNQSFNFSTKLSPKFSNFLQCFGSQPNGGAELLFIIANLFSETQGRQQHHWVTKT